MPIEQRNQLNDLCSMTRLAVGAGSVSIARLEGTELVYEAAEGTGASNVIGLRLPSDRGIAGYVAHTGMSLVVDEVRSDQRFARDVAERVGYVPDSLMAVPVVDADDGVLGVVSILDRTVGIGDPLAIASAAARVAAPSLAMFGAVVRLGPLLVRSVADAVDQNETTLVVGCGGWPTTCQPTMPRSPRSRRCSPHYGSCRLRHAVPSPASCRTRSASPHQGDVGDRRSRLDPARVVGTVPPTRRPRSSALDHVPRTGDAIVGIR